MIQDQPHQHHPSTTASRDFRCMAGLIVVVVIIVGVSLALMLTYWAD